jgi:hypothetical protein
MTKQIKVRSDTGTARRYFVARFLPGNRLIYDYWFRMGQRSVVVDTALLEFETTIKV